jgi:hypothetical protein
MSGPQIIMMLNTAVLTLIGTFTPTAVTFALWAAAICLEYTWALYVAEKLSLGGKGTNSHVIPPRRTIGFGADVDWAHLLSTDFGKSPIWCQIKPTDLPTANRQFGVHFKPAGLPLSTAGPDTS